LCARNDDIITNTNKERETQRQPKRMKKSEGLRSVVHI